MEKPNESYLTDRIWIFLDSNPRSTLRQIWIAMGGEDPANKVVYNAVSSTLTSMRHRATITCDTSTRPQVWSATDVSPADRRAASVRAQIARQRGVYCPVCKKPYDELATL